MRLIKNTTELIGIKDPNIIISLVFETDTHIEVQAKLDYPVSKLLFEVSIGNPTTGTIYHDGYVWSLYSTGSQTLS